MSLSVAAVEPPPDSGQVESALIKLLAHRYGDGLVYLRGQEERELYQKAKLLGFINSDGYLTPAGRSLLTARDA